MSTTKRLSTTPPGHESSSYWTLLVKAKGFRLATGLASSLHQITYSSPSPSSTIWIEPILGELTGTKAIRLDIYHPASMSSNVVLRPAMIVFHGGGFVVGAGTDDADYAKSIISTTGMTIIAVSYRLAPEYPYPTPVEDCASAILHISDYAQEYGIDKTRLFISGFSAGGNLAMASLHLLNNARQLGYTLPSPAPLIRGLILFYPLLDYTISRNAKRATCEKPELTLPPSLTNLFDDSYLRDVNEEDLSSPLLSPGIAPDELLGKLPPIHLVSCEHDMLRSEGQRLVQRLKDMGMEVEERVVMGERHGWDKVPFNVQPSVREEYEAACKALNGWLEKMGDNRDEFV
jgi:acetyl esterase/lipase